MVKDVDNFRDNENNKWKRKAKTKQKIFVLE